MNEGLVWEGPVAPPQDLEAEQSVLGAVLLSGDGRDVVAALVEEGLRPQDFYRDSHGEVFSAMLRMREAGEPIDALTLRDRLARDGKLQLVGGRATVDLLAGSVPAVGNVRQYARIVVRKSMWRYRLRALYAGQDAAHTENEGEYRAALGTMRADELHFRPLLERAEADK